MAKDNTPEEESDSDNTQHDTTNDPDTVVPPVLPKFNVANIKSQVGIIRIIQMVLCMMAFIFLQVSIKCKWAHEIGHGKQFYIQLCHCPSDFIYRCYSASTAVVFFVTFVMFCLHVGNLMEVLSNISWRLVILIQTATSSVMLILAIAILGHGNYVDDSGLLIAVHFFGLIAAVVFALHFVWELILWRKSRNSRIVVDEVGVHDASHANVTYQVSEYDDSEPGGGYAFNENDNDAIDTGGGAGSFKKRNSYSLEMVADCDSTPWRPSEHHIYSNSEGARLPELDRSTEGVDRQPHGYHSNSSGSDDKRSWVITAANKEDTLSTDTYTVEVPLN